MARSRSRRLRRIAQQTAALRSAPQKGALQDALMEAQAGRDSAIDAARATGAGLRAAIKQARPNFAKTYDEGARRLAANAGVIGPNMPTSGAGAAILAAQAGEHQAALDANATARTATLADLTGQRTRAAEGATFAVNNAQSQYQQDVGKVLQKLLGVSQEEGAFAAAEFGRLRENAADRAQSNRNSIRSSGIDPATGKPIPGGRLDPDANGKPGDQSKGKNGKRKFQSDSAHSTAADKIDAAKHWAKMLKGASPTISRAAVAKALANGRPSSEIYEEVDDGRGGKKRQPVLNGDGTVKKTAEIPKLGSNVYLEAALDQVFGGHVSRRATRQLHSRGFLVRKLPLTSYEAWRRAQKRAHDRPVSRPPLAPGANGQLRPT